jgi:asparagine synthase (glutamine-hydrolysing)
MIGGYLIKKGTEYPLCEFRQVSGMNETIKENGIYKLGLFYSQSSAITFGENDNTVVLAQDFLADGDYKNGYNFLGSSDIIRGLEKGFTVYLVSHRAGPGRIYYRKLQSGLVFCSDIKFLIKNGKVEVNNLGVYSILKYGAIPEPCSIINGVEVVPPAHYFHYQSEINRGDLKRYFCLPLNQAKYDASENPDIYLQNTKTALKSSAKILSQKNAGILFSGGIDSTLYLKYLDESSGTKIPTHSLVFGNDDPEDLYIQEGLKASNTASMLFSLTEADVVNIIKEIASSANQPFCDDSIIPVYYILKKALDCEPKCRINIDGNGGDDCFGCGWMRNKRPWEVMFGIPKVFKKLAGLFLLYDGGWARKDNTFDRVLRHFLKVNVDSLQMALINVSPTISFFLKNESSWDKKLSDAFADYFARFYRDSTALDFYQKATVAQIYHICSKWWTAKSLSVDMGINVVYPYLWKDILVEQSRIPMEVKTYGGQVKWPLKRLLEEYMPYDYIYRKKSGFIPPLAGWLMNSEINSFFRETLLSQSAYLKNIILKERINRLLDSSLNGNVIFYHELNFLWAAIFIELWLENNILHKLS